MAVVSGASGDLLESLAVGAHPPGGGALAALTAATAADLVAMVARASVDWDEAGGVVAQADTLRRRAVPLAAANAEAWEAALAALALPERLEPEVRSAAIRDALARAADLPLNIAATAADVALLAEHAVERGEPALRSDAAVAAVLAHGAARACAHLVAVNLTTTGDDERVRRGRALAETAAGAAARALASAAEET
ncbi:MAG: cyclodeaminase/cyclohydrolase family protein [Gaiellaceae bacterium]